MTDNKNALFTAARYYTEKLHIPVFPCKVQDKIPAVSHGFKEASTDAGQIETWWSRTPFNIGIATGGGLVVLDVDINHDGGKYGDETLSELEREHGPLPDTWQVLTGSGGVHYYFQCDDAELTIATSFLDGLDFRANGGYVIAPPSIHPNGRAYEWEVSHTPANCKLAPLPEWLHRLMLSGRKNYGTSPKVEVPEKVTEGKRNDILFRLAASLRAKGLNVNEITAALMEANRNRCNPPLPEHEVYELCQSAGRYAPGVSNPPPASDQARTIYERLREEAPEKKCRYSQDDKGAGRLFAKIFSDKHRWNSTAKEWFFYDGKRWKLDGGSMAALNSAKAFSDEWVRYAVEYGKDGETGDNPYLSYVARYGQLRARKTMLEDARSESYFTQEQLDADGDLFNCQNGTFILSTGEFRPHRAEDMLSKLSNVVYDPAARSPLFEKFINDIMMGDAGKISYLQRRAGLALTTDVSAETCDIWYGPTSRNGKGTLGESLLYMLGGADGYGLSMPPEVLAQKKNKDSRTASGDVARLNGCRFVIASEPPRRMLLDSALLKTLLGRDTITARHLYEREFQFVPAFKLVIGTNYLPLIQDDSVFTSGRVNVVEFPRHFEPHEQDRELKDKLRTTENVAAIFNWCWAGLRLYREIGADPPAAVQQATAAYRENSDKTALFFDECMEASGGNSGAGAVYQRYASWCSANGFGVDSKSSFFDALKSKGLFCDRGSVNGRTVRNIVRGYTIVEDELPPIDNLPL